MNSLSDCSKISLLSSSPRRREIIKALLNPVSISGSRGEEPRPERNETPEEYVVRSALAKLGQGNWSSDDGWLISADTVVALDDEILGKPSSDEEARDMLTHSGIVGTLVVTDLVVVDPVFGRHAPKWELQTSTPGLLRRYIEKYLQGAAVDKGRLAVQDDAIQPGRQVRRMHLNVVAVLCAYLSDR